MKRRTSLAFHIAATQRKGECGGGRCSPRAGDLGWLCLLNFSAAFCSLLPSPGNRGACKQTGTWEGGGDRSPSGCIGRVPCPVLTLPGSRALSCPPHLCPQEAPTHYPTDPWWASEWMGADRREENTILDAHTPQFRVQKSPSSVPERPVRPRNGLNSASTVCIICLWVGAAWAPAHSSLDWSWERGVPCWMAERSVSSTSRPGLWAPRHGRQVLAVRGAGGGL